MEKKFADTLYFHPVTSRTNWGTFRIKGDSIEIERWLSPRGSRGYGCPSRSWKGVIIDEETIVFTEALVRMPINIKKGKIKINGPYEFRDTFHFTPFHPKPDSLHPNIKIPTN